ncbi:MAG: hypothetical protein ACXACA_01080 [Candidatus Ranarchaeia archaeon]|jgi:hypothetical protein
MDPLEASRVITVRPYILEGGTPPSNAKLRSFFSDYEYPRKRVGWNYGFVEASGTGRRRITEVFLAEVGYNVPSYKIVGGEVSKLIVPQKKIEMIGVQFTGDKLEIIGTNPNSTDFLLTLLKNEFNLDYKIRKNNDAILNRVFDACFLIRNIRARTRIGTQEVVVGLRSGENLEESTIAPVFKKHRTFLSVGGQVRLQNKRILSIQSNASGANILFSSKKYPVKWPDIASFMDTLIYPP